MFFYASLIVGSLIVALAVIWLSRSLADVGRAVYRSILPGSKNSATSHLGTQKLASTINDTRTPWGWKSHSTPANQAQTHPAKPVMEVPWGWSGKKDGAREQGSAQIQSGDTQKPTVGWPYREEKSEAEGRVYKVSRRANTPKTDRANAEKPWGW